MTSENANPTDDRLAVVFAPGLWPLRVDLDAFSWLVAGGIARGLSRLPGIVGYATPRSRVDRATERGPIRVYRSLPPEALVRSECDTLNAEWAITGRMLRDKTGFEVWLNLLDGRTNHLLMTQHIFTPQQKLLWRLVLLVRQLARGMDVPIPDDFGLSYLFPTGSYESYVSYARAYQLRHQWRGDPKTGIEIIRAASRAAALDYTFDDAAIAMLDVGLALAERIDRIDDIEALRDAVFGNSDFEPAKRLRRAVHERHLALAEGAKQT